MRLILPSELKALKGIDYSRTHLARLIKAKMFPQPVQVTPGRTAFVEAEIDEWIERLAAARPHVPTIGVPPPKRARRPAAGIVAAAAPPPTAAMVARAYGSDSE